MSKIRTKVKVENNEPIIESPKVRDSSNIVSEDETDKKSLSDSRFERHKAFGDLPKRSDINDKVKQGLLKWSFFALDNDKPYQYYIKIKK